MARVIAAKLLKSVFAGPSTSLLLLLRVNEWYAERKLFGIPLVHAALEGVKSLLPAPFALRFAWIWGHRLQDVPGLSGPCVVEGLVSGLALQVCQDVHALPLLPLPVGHWILRSALLLSGLPFFRWLLIVIGWV